MHTAASSCWERRDFQNPNEIFIATYLEITEKLFRKTFLMFINPCQISLSAKNPCQARENLLDPEKALELIKNKSLPDLIVLVVWMENALHDIKFQNKAVVVKDYYVRRN